MQLAKRKNPENKKKIIVSGLKKYVISSMSVKIYLLPFGITAYTLWAKE